MGVGEIHPGKQQKFLTVVSNLETDEPLWFGRERRKETLDEFFEKELSPWQRTRIEAACVDMWEPYRLNIEQWTPQCRIVHDKFHVMQHANAAVDEVRRAEFFRKGGRWQRLRPFQKLAWMLLDHLDGILNYCRTKVRLGIAEAVNGNIEALMRRGRGYTDLRYLLSIWSSARPGNSSK